MDEEEDEGGVEAPGEASDFASFFANPAAVTEVRKVTKMIKPADGTVAKGSEPTHG